MDKNCKLKDDGLTPEKLARKHSVFVGTIEKEIEKGIDNEYEHTKCKDMARHIAMQHIDEYPDYYTNKKYGLISNEKGLEKVNEGDGIRMSDANEFYKKIRSAKDFDDLSTVKSYYGQKWFDNLPSNQKKKVYNVMLKKIHDITIGGKPKGGPNKIRESIVFKLRTMAENFNNPIQDETPTTLTYDIRVNTNIVGKMTIATRHPDLGKDTIEILDLKLDKRFPELKSTMEAINGLWKKHKSANKIVVTPSDDTNDFWNKLGFNRLNNDYLILPKNNELV